MRVLLCGQVAGEHLADAELIAGIVPTETLTMDDFPPDPLLPDVDPTLRSTLQALCYADALIWAGGDPLVLSYACDFGLTLYEVAR